MNKSRRNQKLYVTAYQPADATLQGTKSKKHCRHTNRSKQSKECNRATACSLPAADVKQNGYHMIVHPPGTPPLSISCSTFRRSALEVMLSSRYLSVGFKGIRLATQKLNFSASVAEGLSPALATSSANLECLFPTAIALQSSKQHQARAECALLSCLCKAAFNPQA